MDLEALLDRTFGAAEDGDWDTFRAAFADDAILRQNIGPARPIDEAMIGLPAYTADGTRLEYQNVRRVVGQTGITEMHDAVFTKPDGREIRLDICVVMEINEAGKIVRAHEYLDSAAAAALFA